MKRYRLLLCLILLGFYNIANAQPGKLPPFRMQQADGKVFKAEDLPLGKPIVIVYFSPDCDHCSNLMKAMLAKTNDLKKASVVMVTYLPLQSVSKFSEQYGMQKFPSIYVGTEGSTLFLKNYYHLTSMPFMALYTKNGDLVKTHSSETGFTDLVNRLKLLP